MVPFVKRTKMEIFKLFNEWPKSPEKENKTIINKCQCNILSKEILEKDEIIKKLGDRIEEFENQINEIKEYDKQVQAKITQLEHDKKKLQEKNTEKNCEISNLKIERDKFKNNSDMSSAYLKNVEFSFNDVHSKYERAKTLIEELRMNENNLCTCIQAHENTITLLIQQYTDLKCFSIQQFEDANILVNNVNQERESTIAQMHTKIRKLEITTAALDQNLQQKSVENEELSAICDELINKQHSHYIQDVKGFVTTK